MDPRRPARDGDDAGITLTAVVSSSTLQQGGPGHRDTHGFSYGEVPGVDPPGPVESAPRDARRTLRRRLLVSLIYFCAYVVMGVVIGLVGASVDALARNLRVTPDSLSSLFLAAGVGTVRGARPRARVPSMRSVFPRVAVRSGASEAAPCTPAIYANPSIRPCVVVRVRVRACACACASFFFLFLVCTCCVQLVGAVGGGSVLDRMPRRCNGLLCLCLVGVAVTTAAVPSGRTPATVHVLLALQGCFAGALDAVVHPAMMW
jgi:hypothetical protein